MPVRMIAGGRAVPVRMIAGDRAVPVQMIAGAKFNWNLQVCFYTQDKICLIRPNDPNNSKY